MNYIQNLFHFYDTNESFEIHREQGLINPDSICFLRETGQIYTQGLFFGVDKKVFKQLEKVVLEHEIAINNIIGTRGPSVNDGIINNITDLVNFLNGFTDKDNLVDCLDAMNTALVNQINAVNDSLTDKIDDKVSNLQYQFDELDDKFDRAENNLAKAEVITEQTKILAESIKEDFDKTKSELDDFKDKVDSKINGFETSIGAPNGITPLDEDAKVPSAYLPSYVDDVVEYPTKSDFPVPGESGKIYVALDDNLTYRWSGTQYSEISKSIALGETSSTAYPGSKGKQTTDDLNAHITDYDNPHRVTAEQVGLGNVDNTSDLDKPISTATQDALDALSESIDEKVGGIDLSDYETIEGAEDKYQPKEEGKGLSSNDYTDEEKERITTLEDAVFSEGGDFIDLGLPSGLLWATKNIGASKPEDVGLYFAIGETQGYSDSQIGDGAGQREFSTSEYTLNTDDIFTTYGKTLKPEYDVVTQTYGVGRIPTSADILELLRGTTPTLFMEDNDGNIVEIEEASRSDEEAAISFNYNEEARYYKAIGVRLTAENGNSIFIPCTGVAKNGGLSHKGYNGYFQSSSYYNKIDGIPSAYGLGFNYSGISRVQSSCYVGIPVRGVTKTLPKSYRFYTKEEVGNQLQGYATKEELSEVSGSIPTVPTNVSAFTNDSKYQTEAQVDSRIQQIVGAAPEALDTLEEIADKLEDSDDIHSVLINTIAERATKTELQEATTATALLDKIKTVDGSGSGLDADTADTANKLTAKRLINEDLDSIVDTSFIDYYGIYGNSCANKPVPSNTFGLRVQPTGFYVKQTFTRNDESYTRSFVGSGWTAWKKVLTEDDLANQVKTWVGTQDEYDALTTKDSNTLYCIPEE